MIDDALPPPATAPAEPPAAGPAPRAPRVGARVDIVGMCKEYLHGGRVLSVLHGVELHLAAGDMVAVVGASGVGKSTFLQILGTLDLPTRGSIKFDGEELTTMGPERLAMFRNRKIGFVFQFHHLLPEFTALENVMMPGLIQRLPKAQVRQRAADILGRVGLSRRLTHKPSELSGGEQQRVALARGAGQQAPRCCWPTSPPATSTGTPARRSTSCSSSCTASAARRCWSSPTTSSWRA